MSGSLFGYRESTMIKFVIGLVVTLFVLTACSGSDDKDIDFPDPLTIESWTIATKDVTLANSIADIPCDKVLAEITFSEALNPSTVNTQNFKIADAAGNIIPAAVTLKENRKVVISISNKLRDLTKYILTVSTGIAGVNGSTLSERSLTFYTAIDETPDSPMLTDDELLTRVQKQTFRYFWD